MDIESEKRQAAAARLREHEEPHEGQVPIPKLVIVTVALIFGWGAWYITQAPINQSPALGDQRTEADLRPKPGGAAGGGGGVVDGAAVFQSRCVACHQATGTGLPGVFPPLADSEWVKGDEKQVASIVLRGITGTLTVKGGKYAGAMPPFADQLGDGEIAAVLTYVRGQWGNGAQAITPETVAAARAATASMTAPYAGDSDLKAPGG
jgi:mono/diheme cytochrome c family protein